MWEYLKRSFKQSFTYGIGHDLTPREKKRWIFWLYVLLGTSTYYQLKDRFRTEDEGSWSLWSYLKSEITDPDVRLERELRTLSYEALISDLSLAIQMNDQHYVNQITNELERRSNEPVPNLSHEEILKSLKDLEDKDLMSLGNMWNLVNEEDLTEGQHFLHNAIQKELDKRLPF